VRSRQFWASYRPFRSRVIGRGTRQTDRRTDRHRPSFHNALSLLYFYSGRVVTWDVMTSGYAHV